MGAGVFSYFRVIRSKIGLAVFLSLKRIKSNPIIYLIARLFGSKEKQIFSRVYFYNTGHFKTFHNVFVVPFENYKSGKGSYDSPKVGGPIWLNWPEAVEYRHHKNRKLVDILPEQPGDHRQVIEKAVWVGPIVPAFGHQIGEFGGRLFISALLKKEHPLLFAIHCNSHIKDIFDSPKYFLEILKWFQVDVDRVRLVKEPTLVKSLEVIREQECLNGPGPSKEYLDLLTDWSNDRIRSKKLIKNEYLYVSRSKTRVPLAGEMYLEKVLSKLGFQIFHPEEHSLEDQLMIYAGSKNIVFAGGSAVFGLQLMGRLDINVFILMRIPRHQIAKYALKPRCQRLKYFNVVDRLIITKEDHLELGLPILNQEKVSSFVKRLFPKMHFEWNEDEHQNAIDTDINNWLSKNRSTIAQNLKIRNSVYEQLDRIRKAHLLNPSYYK